MSSSISMLGRYVILLALASAPVAASAEFYSWTDENGNVHFGDAPPATGRAERVDIKKDAMSGGGAEGGSAARLIMLDKAVQDVKVGHTGLGQDCRRKGASIPHSDLRSVWHRDRFDDWMHALLAEKGYNAPPARGRKPKRAGATSEADISIIAVVEEIRFSRCAYDTRIKVRWRVLDHATKSVVFEDSLDGRSVARRTAVVQRSTAKAFQAAWLDSAKKLIARAEFAQAASAAPAAPSRR